MYLHRNPHGVYYYRRPILAEDQTFWIGPNGTPKKEWSRSLRTKDRREAILALPDAADLYEVERHAQLARYLAGKGPERGVESEREQEEREAVEAALSAQQMRREARRELRVEKRLRARMSTLDLSPEEAAWHDLLRERDAELEQLRAAVDGQRAVNAALVEEGGANAQRPSVITEHTVEALIAAYEADKSPRWSGSSKKAVVPVFHVLRDVFGGREVDGIRPAIQRWTLLPRAPRTQRP